MNGNLGYKQKYILKELIRLQELLASISTRSLKRPAQEIAEMSFSFDIELFPYIIINLTNMIHIFPRKIPLYVTLLKNFINSKTSYNCIENTIPTLMLTLKNDLEIKHAFPMHICYLSFLKNLFEQQILSFDSFFHYLRFFNPNSSIPFYTRQVIFLYFAPEFFQLMPDFSKEILESLSYKLSDPFCESIIREIVHNMIEIQKNSWELHCQYRSTQSFTLTTNISSILQHDDLSALRLFLYETRNVNSRISPSLYEISPYAQNSPTLLQYSALYGSSKCFQFLLSNNADITLQDSVKNSIAFFAMAGGSSVIIKAISNLSVDALLPSAILFFRNDFYFQIQNTTTPLFNGATLEAIIKSSNMKIFEFFIEHLPESEQVSPLDYNMTPLHLACKLNSLSIARYLINENYLMKMDSFGRTPIHYAIASNSYQILKLIVSYIKGEDPIPMANDFILSADYGYDFNSIPNKGKLNDSNTDFDLSSLVNKKDSFEMTPIHLAAKCRNQEIMKLLLSIPQSDPNIQTKFQQSSIPSIPSLSISNFEECFSQLGIEFDHYEKSKKNSVTAIHIAAEEGDAGMINILLKSSKVDVDCVNDSLQTPLIVAADHGHSEVCRVLIENGAKINKSDSFGWTALHCASCRGHAEVIKVLLENDSINPNITRKPGRTPLHDASDRGQIECISLLLDSIKVDPNIQDECRSTPLFVAIDRGYFDAAIILIKNPRVNINIEGPEGQTPLHRAAMNGTRKLIEAFMERADIDINRTNRSGETPLLIAALNRNKEIINILLKNHANATISNIAGLTPVIAATKAGMPEIVKMIRQSIGAVKIDKSITVSRRKPCVQTRKVNDSQNVSRVRLYQCKRTLPENEKEQICERPTYRISISKETQFTQRKKEKTCKTNNVSDPWTKVNWAQELRNNTSRRNEDSRYDPNRRKVTVRPPFHLK